MHKNGNLGTLQNTLLNYVYYGGFIDRILKYQKFSKIFTTVNLLKHIIFYF